MHQSGLRRDLCSSLDEKRDSNEGNNDQGGASDEHVTDMISCRARSRGYLLSSVTTGLRADPSEFSFLGATWPIDTNLWGASFVPHAITLGAHLDLVKVGTN